MAIPDLAVRLWFVPEEAGHRWVPVPGHAVTPALMTFAAGQCHTAGETHFVQLRTVGNNCSGTKSIVCFMLNLEAFWYW